MSDTDSFIEEVTEEVRRDKLFQMMRRYGWIAILAVVLLVGGAGWREYQKAQATAAAQAFGDAMLTALEPVESADRVAALSAITAPGPGGEAVLQMLIAAETGSSGDDASAVAQLQAVADNPDVPGIYRQIASYKALTRGFRTLDVQTRQAGFEALAIPGQPLRLLAEEQLALIEIETGRSSAALDRLQRLIQDSEVTSGLRRRASQLIVALGGTPDAA